MSLKNIISKTVIVFIIAAATFQFSYAQNVKKDKKSITFTKALIDSQGFVFVPNTMTPMRGGSRTLTSGYQLTVSKDTVISYLPYIGRAYTAPVLPGENGFDFTSTNFEYKIKENRKGGWDVLVRPKDKMNVQQFVLRIFDNGSASLNVSSMNRDPISYTGFITPGKQ
jgi:hypothetical protein